MALSDQLASLAARAKQAETRAAAAQRKAKGDLETDISAVRASAEAQAQKLRETAEAGEGKISDWWTDVQKTWNDHIAAVREDIDDKKAKHELHEAQYAADMAEGDASYAIDYAYAAVEEAEYAVLQAELARMDADELEAAAHATA
jgi:hypothetical protein